MRTEAVKLSIVDFPGVGNRTPWLAVEGIPLISTFKGNREIWVIRGIQPLDGKHPANPSIN